jgi:hypothetical protein
MLTLRFMLNVERLVPSLDYIVLSFRHTIRYPSITIFPANGSFALCCIHALLDFSFIQKTWWLVASAWLPYCNR